MRKDQKTMPDVPPPDFVGAVAEIWSTVNYGAYHLAYTRVYLQTRALQTSVDELRRDEQAVRDQGQVDLFICRAHLAAFFWQLHHVFEALELRSEKARRTTRQKDISTVRSENSRPSGSQPFREKLTPIATKATTFRQSSASNGMPTEILCIISCPRSRGTKPRNRLT